MKNEDIPIYGDLERSAVKYLKENCYSGDIEVDHSNVDNLLITVLNHIGLKRLVKEWKKIDKWYA